MSHWKFTIKGPGITNWTLIDWCNEQDCSFYVDYRYSDFERVDTPNGGWDIRNVQVFDLTVYTEEMAAMAKLRWGDFILDEAKG